MRRRELIVGSGTVAAIAFSGYTGAAAADAADRRTSLPSDLESTLELVPAESSLETSYQHLVYSQIDSQESRPGYLGTHGVVDEFDNVDADSVAEIVFAAGEATQLSVTTGSFDKPDAGDDEIDGWTVGEVDDEAFAAADGKLVIASGDGSRSVVETAIATANGDEATVITDPETTEATFDYLGSMSYVTFVPNVSTTSSREFNDGTVEAVGIGSKLPPAERSDDGTLENGYVFHLAADADVDDEWVNDRLQRLEQGEVLDTTIDRSGDVVHVDAVVEQPPERDRDAAPDARVQARSNADEGVVTFEHVAGESIDTDNLELWKNGELAAEQLADDRATFDEGDTFELETGPLAAVGLRWFDEDEDVYYYYETITVGSESFDVTHDETDTVDITYVGEREADPDLLELVRDDGAAGREQLELDVSDSLTAGETITVEDVTLGNRVMLELAVPANPNRGRRSLVHFRVRPPRMHLSGRNDTVTARYWGDQDRDADEFRVLVEDEPADVQFTDVTETLSANDEVELGDIDYGTHVAIEWLEPDEPTVIADRVIRPSAHVDLAYDDAEGTLTVDYVEGDAIDADDLSLRLGDEPTAVQPTDEYETFEPGDAFTVDVRPFVRVKLVWEGPDDTEHSISQTTVSRALFDAAYDPDNGEVELVYTGNQPADPSTLSVAHRRDGPSSVDEDLFAQAYDTLTTGDSIVLEDVGVEDSIAVMLVQEGENYVSKSSLFNFRPEPRWAFSIGERADGIVAVYREETSRDAANFELLVDGEPGDSQPSDRYDTLSAGDELELGEFDAGTELTFRWVVPDEPREIRSHVVVPDAAFDIDYDADDGEVTVEHAGGDEIDADALGIVVEPTRSEPAGWDEYETVTEGDTTTVAVDGETGTEGDRDPIGVTVVYREKNTITHERIDD
ncbi:type IV pilin N-terminal domain-containing protein [Natrialba asiatica]|uniref:Uncharacterized protein n=1 Tax=Natrialba asiatica (strain ATCC 700177 / DSM 12278 / JCM 9576 / FERM P-10747 / NBRC 102637 / 172P1) TaxID=29540 RepID=M0ATI2_NATA1|nr:type IV pilin N-terminal domain-containing protein [Natrialba asiatica]ELZ01860.1 hypothetical protein C481_10077 [Natrialba asiatica DSM 12278]